MKIILALGFALALAGCGADIAVRPSLGLSVGPSYGPDYYGGGGYYHHRWHRRGWW